MMMIGGVVLFKYGKDLVDGGATNAGELLKPPTPLADLGLDDVPGPGLWRLLLVCEQPGHDDCILAAKLLNSVPILLGKDQPRLRLVVATLHGAMLPVAMAGWAQTETSLDNLQQQLIKQGGLVSPYDNYVLLVDPDSSVVLLYRRELLGSPLLTDLKRLLRLSQIG